MKKKLGALKRNIRRYSQAINKIDTKNRNTLGLSMHNVKNITMGITEITIEIDARIKKVNYKDIDKLSSTEQSAIYAYLSEKRNEARTERLTEELATKGKIHGNLKRAIQADSPSLAKQIEGVERLIQDSDIDSDNIIDLYKTSELVSTNLEAFEDAEEYFNGPDGSEFKFDFYRPGQAGGFDSLNIFTWNTYKALRGL